MEMSSPRKKEQGMKWDSSFAIGIEEIDNQHKKIFEHLLALENSVEKRDSWHIQHFFLTELRGYMKFHLAVEEALLEIIRYPDRASHCDSHSKLIEQIARLEDQLKGKATGDNLVGFFEGWFIRHVLAGDREYAAYIVREFPALAGKRSA
jgi:hemerythrin